MFKYQGYSTNVSLVTFDKSEITRIDIENLHQSFDYGRPIATLDFIPKQKVLLVSKSTKSLSVFSPSTHRHLIQLRTIGWVQQIKYIKQIGILVTIEQLGDQWIFSLHRFIGNKFRRLYTYVPKSRQDLEGEEGCSINYFRPTKAIFITTNKRILSLNLKKLETSTIFESQEHEKITAIEFLEKLNKISIAFGDYMLIYNMKGGEIAASPKPTRLDANGQFINNIIWSESESMMYTLGNNKIVQKWGVMKNMAVIMDEIKFGLPVVSAIIFPVIDTMVALDMCNNITLHSMAGGKDLDRYQSLTKNEFIGKVVFCEQIMTIASVSLNELTLLKLRP